LSLSPTDRTLSTCVMRSWLICDTCSRPVVPVPMSTNAPYACTAWTVPSTTSPTCAAPPGRPWVRPWDQTGVLAGLLAWRARAARGTDRYCHVLACSPPAEASLVIGACSACVNPDTMVFWQRAAPLALVLP